MPTVSPFRRSVHESLRHDLDALERRRVALHWDSQRDIADQLERDSHPIIEPADWRYVRAIAGLVAALAFVVWAFCV
jgi:hypothetical protein